MKRILLLLLPLFYYNIAQAQLTVVETEKTQLVGKIAPMGQLHASIEKSGDSYMITYSDAKFQQINDYKTVTFNDQNGEFETLYDLIIDGFYEMPKEDIKIVLGEDMVWLHFEKNLGVKSFQFAHSSSAGVFGFSPYLTKKKVQKLFGKR